MSRSGINGIWLIDITRLPLCSESTLSSQIKSSCLIWPSPIFIYGPQFMPTSTIPSTSVIKRSACQISVNVLHALCDQVVSWLPGIIYNGLAMASRIGFTLLSSSSLPSFVKSPARIATSASLELMAFTTSFSFDSFAFPGDTWISHKKAILVASAPTKTDKKMIMDNRYFFMINTFCIQIYD